MLNQIAVLGSGSWATALVKLFAESGVPVSWHVRTTGQADYIISNGRNPRYLSFASLDLQYVTPTTSIQHAVEGAQLVIFAVPSAYLQSTVQSIEPDLLLNKQIAVSVKGMVPGTGMVPGHFLQKALNVEDVMVLAGPCHAEEIAMQRNTYLTVSGINKDATLAVCNLLQLHYLRTISNYDPLGVEYGAILKNIMGIASGIASGLNYGDNFQAVLISNAMREIHSFLHAVSPIQRDLYDSAYFGDMLVTAYSDHSRNRTLGKLLGRGLRIDNALNKMEMVAEGYKASEEIAPLIQRLQVNMPITTAVYRILHQHSNPYTEFSLLENQLR